jgi:hypothetical protein
MQSSHEISAQVRVVLQDHPDLLSRFLTLQRLAVSVRPSEFHVTNACNIRCDGCWFFAFGHDKTSNEVRDVDRLNNVIEEIRARKRINAALLIGGEPTLFPDRLQVFRSKFRYLTISTNGLRQLPKEGFEDVAVGITLFGGGPLDDQLRGIKPGGQRFTGLLQTALANYRDDPRAGFIFALTEPGVGYIEDTVRRIQDNGNRVQFSYYSNYGGQGGTVGSDAERLLDEALRVKELYAETVVSHPYYIRALITGKSHFGAFGYDVCPSISVDHSDHAARQKNGNPYLPFFNSYAADGKTVNFCCTSGHCVDCRDSQAVLSWLLVSLAHFTGTLDEVRTWIEVAESYWRQFIWGPLHWTKGSKDPANENIEAVGETPAIGTLGL